MLSASVCGSPLSFSHVRSWNPKLSTPSVSPSQRPTEYPIQVGLGAVSSLRPSMKIWRYVRSSFRIAMRLGVWRMRFQPPTFSGPPGRHWKLGRSEEHSSELQSRGHLVCRLLLEKKKKKHEQHIKIPLNTLYS